MTKPASHQFYLAKNTKNMPQLLFRTQYLQASVAQMVLFKFTFEHLNAFRQKLNIKN